MAQGTLHGVNLAGWLMLEPWVTPELFADTGALDEAALANRLGAERFSHVVRAHLDTFVTEKDFAQIALRGYNAVRLPLPWHVFGADGPLAGAHCSRIEYVDRAMDWAEANGLVVLLDIALAPGASITSDGLRMEVDSTPVRRAALLQVVGMLAARYAERQAFFGIEPLDEVVVQRRRGLTVVPGMPLPHLRNLYRDAYEAVRSVAGKRPVVVLSDADRSGSWRRFMAGSRYENVWLDTHLYRFAEHTAATGPAGARLLVEESRRELEAARESGLPVMVGGWSAALPVTGASMTAEGRIATERMYVASQLAMIEDCPAWFFQTWKTSGRIGDWDARVALSSFERDMI